jgi:hypothetical protein
MNARQYTRKVADGLGIKYGCTDSGCIFGHHGGMGTNGGCECHVGERNDLRLKLLAMAKVARELAQRCIEHEEGEK